MHLSADGHDVVIHDATLDRTAQADSPLRTGAVAELTRAQLDRVLVGKGEHIPTLAQVLEAAVREDGTRVPLLVEIKAPAVADRVVSMHASDRYLAEGASLDDLRQADGTLGYSSDLRHGVTGKGLNDYDAIFRILADHKYRGWVSIEDGMNGMGEMAESLAFLRKMGAKYFPD